MQPIEADAQRVPMPAPNCQLRSDGARALHHRARLSGAGEQFVVLGHGLGCDQAVWQAIRPTLDERFRVLSFDLAGVGPQAPTRFDPRRYAHLSGHADDLLALLEETGASRCRYVGHSVAGMVGLLASVEAPALFDRLVLINASPRYLDDADYRGGFTSADLDSLFEAMQSNYEAWVAGFAPRVVGTAAASAIDAFAAGFLAMRPDVTVAIARAIFESDLRGLLAAVTVPVTLIHSRRDVAVPPSVSDYLLARVPGARRSWIDSDGHVPQLTDPASVLAALGEAL